MGIFEYDLRDLLGGSDGDSVDVMSYRGTCYDDDEYWKVCELPRQLLPLPFLGMICTWECPLELRDLSTGNLEGRRGWGMTINWAR